MTTNRFDLLVATFQRINDERMQGLGFLNPRLKVDASNTTEWQDELLGVLVTPWFINLMLLPLERDSDDSAVGQKTYEHFPSGDYEFITGFEADVGRYRMCSLFSPVQEFEDHAAAMATANAVMTALMDVNNQETLNNYQYWDAEEDQSAEPAVLDAKVTTAEVKTAPLSRRALLRGRRHDTVAEHRNQESA